MRFACLLIMFLFATACSTERSPEPLTETAEASHGQAVWPADTGKPAVHAIHNSGLQLAMEHINSLVYRQMREEVSASVEARQRSREVAKTAGELSGAVQEIIAGMPALHLGRGDQATFRALADKLRLYARQMEEQANWSQIHALPATMDAITSTCVACHTLFRKTRGVLQ